MIEFNEIWHKLYSFLNVTRVPLILMFLVPPLCMLSQAWNHLFSLKRPALLALLPRTELQAEFITLPCVK